MRRELDVLYLLRKNLPSHSEILYTNDTPKKPLILISDLDGDGTPEVVGAYLQKGNPYLIVLKKTTRGWRPVDHIKGSGYGISYLNIANIVNEKKNNLVVGWQIGSIWSTLAIYEWTRDGLINVVPNNFSFSMIQVEDMRGPFGLDGKAELALWVHDTGEAYKIEVYRWKQGRLIQAKDVYPYYFKKVVPYYEQKTREMPEAAFYWYYLADAQFKAGLPASAMESIKKGMSLHSPYPSQEEWLKLKQAVDTSFMRNTREGRLYPASVKTIDGVKWGYINSEGKLVIHPQYAFADDFQENGLAIVQIENHSGVIDSSGRFVVKPMYQTITKFSEGRAEVVDDQGFQVIDEQGNLVTSEHYDFIGMFQEGRALFNKTVQEKSWYGYLDRQGKEVIPAQYESGSDFKTGKAIVQIKDGLYALIGLDGEQLQTYSYHYVGNLGDGGLIAFQQTQDSKLGYMNEEGKTVISPRYSGAQPFENGRAIVNLSDDFSNNKYGLIDTKGTLIIKAEYNDLQLLGESRVAVGKAKVSEQPYLGSLYAIADINGHFLTDFHYDLVLKYSQGLASVCDGYYTYFIDLTGKKVNSLPILRGGGTLSLQGNIIQAVIDQRTSYYDQNGKLIWKQNTVIPLKPPYQVREQKYAPNKDYYVYYPQINGMANNAAQNQVNQKLKQLSGVKYIDPQAQLDYSYAGDFSIEFYKDHLLVVEMEGYNYPFGAAHGMPMKVFAHVDLVSGKIYELKDLFKPNSPYVKTLSDIIGEQIKTNPEYSYVFPDSYKGIQPDQPFYVKEQALYIYFTPYEIAPYAAGFPTFIIPYNQILDIINRDGAFWKSFHI